MICDICQKAIDKNPDVYRNSQMCIVTAPNQEIAITQNLTNEIT